jgi:endoglucanase
LHWAGPLDDADYLQDIVEIVEYIETKPGVYVLVSLWTHPSLDDMGWPTQATIPVWEALTEALVDKPHVMFGVCNEPQSNFDGSLDADVWDRMTMLVEAIRAVEAAHGDNRHIITVQGTRAWARHLGYYVDHPITAGGGVNIAYETHSYMPPSDFEENWIAPSATLPVIIGEFGPFEMTVDDTVVMMDEAESRDIPWLAWTFHQRCPPNLLVDHEGNGCGFDMELTPTDDWGVTIRDRLAEPWGSR